MAKNGIRVCHMAASHWPEDVRIFIKECRSLAKAGYEVYLVEVGDTYDKDGVHIIGVGEQYENRKERMTKGRERVYNAALKVDADIYHFHEPELLPLGLRLKKKGKTVIYDSHEHTAEAIKEKTYIPAPIRKLVQIAFSKYQSYVCRRLDAVITATPNVTEYFVHQGCKAIDVMNYPIIKEFKDNEEKQANTVFYAGNVTEQWNIDHVISALTTIDNSRFILCGNIPESYKNRLTSNQGWRKVDYRGRVTHDTVEALMSSATVGVALLSPGPNTDYNRGNLANTKLFENMMAGVPVVCTDFERWKAIIAKHNCGICVNPFDEKQIECAFRKLFDDRTLAAQMGRNGRKAVEEEFNWEHEEKKLLQLYKELTERLEEKNK